MSINIPVKQPTKDFVIYWLGGNSEVVSGSDIASAFSKAGYGGETFTLLISVMRDQKR